MRHQFYTFSKTLGRSGDAGNQFFKHFIGIAKWINVNESFLMGRASLEKQATQLYIKKNRVGINPSLVFIYLFL